MCWYMRNQLLRDTDWASMDHSLEVRTPLVDATLLRELGPQLAGENPPTKRDMALAAIEADDPHPSDGRGIKGEGSRLRTPHSALRTLLDRSKTGFVVPVRDWLLDDTPHSP